MTLDLEAIETRCEAARCEVNRLCRGDVTWTMSIPVRDDDTDIILTNSFHDIPMLLAEVKRLQIELREMWMVTYLSERKCDEEVERLRASLEAILEETASDLDRDIIFTECQSALSEEA